MTNSTTKQFSLITLPPQSSKSSVWKPPINDVQSPLNLQPQLSRFQSEDDSAGWLSHTDMGRENNLIMRSLKTPQGSIQAKCEACATEDKQEKEETIQPKLTQGIGTQTSRELESRLSASKGGGAVLAPSVRAFMEPRFGTDFSRVRVHTGRDAVQMNQEIGAQAFTHGSDVYFGEGKSPGNNELTAHELTHVVQQTGANQLKSLAIPSTVERKCATCTQELDLKVKNHISQLQRKTGDGHDLTSSRFAGDPVLEACYDGQQEQYLRLGSSGSAVEKIQQALINLGYPLPKFGADGKFGDETAAAVSAFKRNYNITPSDGVVGTKTIAQLDILFANQPPVPPNPPIPPHPSDDSLPNPLVGVKELILKPDAAGTLQTKMQAENTSVAQTNSLEISPIADSLNLAQTSNLQLKADNNNSIGNPPKVNEEATKTLWIPWKGSINSSLYIFLSNLIADPQKAAKLTNRIIENVSTYLVDGKPSSQADFMRYMQKNPQFYLDKNLKQILLDYFKTDHKGLENLRDLSKKIEKLNEDLGLTDPIERGQVGPTQKGDKKGQAGPKAVKVNKDWSCLLDNSKLADLYLDLMKKFGNIDNELQARAAAKDGLSEDEIDNLIVKKDNRKSYLTSIFCQGYREFISVGGKSLNEFTFLEERIFEQISWGNANAIRNQLEIGKGWPEEGIIGIINRTTKMLWYDQNATPLVSPSLTTYRDSEYVGAPPPKTFGINITAIKDPALKGFLNALRQQASDPVKMVAMGAEAYFQNMEEINQTVKQGLPADIAKAFEDMFKIMFGFFLGDQAAKRMITMEPPFPAIAVALEAMLVAANYYMKLDMWGSALKRIIQAGYHLVRISPKSDQGRDSLSQRHFDTAVELLRSLAVDIALIAGVEVLMATLRAGQKASLGCDSPCDFECEGKSKKPKSTPESVPEAKAAEALEKLQTESRTKIEDLKEKKAETKKTIDQLNREIAVKKQKIAELRREANVARTSKKETVKGKELIERITTPEEKQNIEEARKAGIPEWQIQDKVLTQKAEEMYNNQQVPLETKRSKARTIDENTQNEINDLEGIIKIPDKAGGSYKDVRAKTNGGEVNHMPAKDAYLGKINLSEGEGPSIWMLEADHKKLKSTGSSAEAKAHRLKQQELIQAGKFKEAFELDVADIREKFPDGRYEKGIQQALNYLNSINPSKLKP